jgi:CRISPR-associated endoribonuclease Cas6
MPVTFTIRLRPFRPWRPDTRQLHGLACALFENGTADHGSQEKQFAVWPVTPDPADPYVGLLLRCSWLGEGASPLDVAAASATGIRLGGAPCALVGVEARTESYAELATSPPAETATLTFRSPTYFSRNGENLLLPDPRLMLSGYRRRWNRALPPGSALHVDDALWRRLYQAVRLGPYELHTAEMDSGRGYRRAGFVGTATLQLVRGTAADARAAFATLLRFAAYCGTGAQTTHGFGATTSVLHTASGTARAAAHG